MEGHEIGRYVVILKMDTLWAGHAISVHTQQVEKH